MALEPKGLPLENNALSVKQWAAQIENFKKKYVGKDNHFPSVVALCHYLGLSPRAWKGQLLDYADHLKMVEDAMDWCESMVIEKMVSRDSRGATTYWDKVWGQKYMNTVAEHNINISFTPPDEPSVLPSDDDLE